MHGPRVVVGVDGSEPGRAALRWAMEEAVLLGGELEVVHASRGRSDDDARALLAEELAAVGTGAGLVPVLRWPAHGHAARELVERSDGAALVVVGRSGRSHRVLGTVAEQVARHALCPVVVVPPITARGDCIVVGMDGSAPATAALHWAHAEARRTGTRLVALLAWTLLEQLPRPGGPQFDPHYSDDDAAAALDAALTGALGDDAVDVGREIVNDLPDSALVAAGASADAIVVGSRGLGGFETLLLGSVATKVLERSPCPAVVVRET